MKKKIINISALTYITIIIGFLTQVMIVRLLDVNEYGSYALLVAILSLIEAPLVTRGSELSLKKAGEKWNNKEFEKAIAVLNYIKHTEKKMYWTVYFVLVVCSILFSTFIKADPVYLMVIFFSIPMHIGYGSYKSFFTITDNVVLQSIVEVCFAFFNILAAYCGALMFGLLGVLGSVAFSAFVKTQASKYFYKRLLADYSIYSDSVKELEINKKEYHVRGLNSMFRMFTQNGILQIDVIIIGLFQLPDVVATYKIGKSLAGLPTKVAVPIWKYFYPALVKSNNLKDEQLQRKTIMNGSMIVLGLFAVLFVSLFFLGEDLIQFLYGKEYQGAYLIFMVLMVGYGFFYAVNGWFKIWIALIDRYYIGCRYYLVIFFLVAAESVFLNFNTLYLSMSISLLLIAMTFYSYVMCLKTVRF